jgi:formylglycine-generating enzyme required for sulfatase activity
MGAAHYDISPTRGYHPDYNDVGPFTAPVGSFSANGYGLYDMTGNVREWCNDRYLDTYYSTTPYPHVNPTGPLAGGDRVIHDGAWGINARDCRVSHRISGRVGSESFLISTQGFRVALKME